MLRNTYGLKAGQLITARGRAGVIRGWGMTGMDNYSGLAVLGSPQQFFRQPSIRLRGINGIVVSWVGAPSGSSNGLVTY